FSAAIDAFKETLFFLTIFAMVVVSPPWSLFFSLSVSLVLWKSMRALLLGWSRLSRLHRIVAQEKWEIEHNREQEREELTAIYRLKGFRGKMLEDVIETLMADDQRLLQVMIEDELGLKLGCEEHPLRQGAGAACGVIMAAFSCALGGAIWPSWGIITVGGALLAITTVIGARARSNPPLSVTVWTLGGWGLALGVFHSLAQAFG
ncbi:MAG: VIT1/CCC1 transporter family protein, partial [Chlamydiota bacterium]|nr:VIT1/CCC1 transporter family protein [Chlamydiota bacterium]